MSETVQLNTNFQNNEELEVIGFQGDELLIERLKELGFYVGVKIRYVGKAPFAGPLLIRLGATVMALRQEEAACLRMLRA
jgi:ferrous iron transport protein A